MDKSIFLYKWVVLPIHKTLFWIGSRPPFIWPFIWSLIVLCISQSLLISVIVFISSMGMYVVHKLSEIT